LRAGYAQTQTPDDTNPAPPASTQRIPLIDPGKTITATVTPAVERPSPDAVAQTPAPGQTAKQEDHSAGAPRKKQLIDDTANLVKLANSLKAEVAKTTPDTMSVPVIRQAEEIEKLARKMRTE